MQEVISNFLHKDRKSPNFSERKMGICTTCAIVKESMLYCNCYTTIYLTRLTMIEFYGVHTWDMHYLNFHENLNEFFKLLVKVKSKIY